LPHENADFGEFKEYKKRNMRREMFDSKRNSWDNFSCPDENEEENNSD